MSCNFQQWSAKSSNVIQCQAKSSNVLVLKLTLCRCSGLGSTLAVVACTAGPLGIGEAGLVTGHAAGTRCAVVHMGQTWGGHKISIVWKFVTLK